MIVPIALIEIDPNELRLYGGWVEVGGMRMRIDYRILRADPLDGFDFDTLMAAARDGRRLLLDEAEGGVTLEAASAAAPGAALPPPSLES